MAKTYLAAVIIFIMVLSGCTKENPINAPLTAGTDQRTLINLPKTSGEQVEAEFYACNFINGYLGGSVTIDRQYWTKSGLVKIYARIKFKPNAFAGVKLIKMMIDDVHGSISFDPPSVFSRPAYLDLKFVGVDLSGVNPQIVDFVYVSPDGSLEPITYKSMTVDISAKTLEVKEAEINHFSRYAWCR